jgi:hypothetical protein
MRNFIEFLGLLVIVLLGLFFAGKYRDYQSRPEPPSKPVEQEVVFIPTVPTIPTEGTTTTTTQQGEAPVATTTTTQPVAVVRGNDKGKDAILPGTMELYPTYTSIGIDLPYNGDANGDAGASFVWRRQGDQKWRNGVDMTIDRPHERILASIWPLEQGQVIEVQLTLSDPTPFPTPISGVVTTRVMRLQTSGGRTLYVSPRGRDSNDGAKDAPFKTIAKAVEDLKAGDTVLVMSGVYHESIHLPSKFRGTEAQPIVICAAPGQKPVMDGSETIGRGHAWHAADPGIYYANVAGGEEGVKYLAQDGLRVYYYGTYEALKANTFEVPRAWCYDKARQKLFVRLAKNDTPHRHSYNYSTNDYAFYLEGTRSVVVRGFEIRYYGASGVRISGTGSANNTLYENTIHNVPGAVFMKTDTAVDNAIWRCVCYEPGLSDFSWTAIKRSEYARQAIIADKCGRGVSVCYNTIHGFFDGIDIESWKVPEELQMNRDSDAMYNTIYNIGDDAFELDGGGLNMRCHGNTIRNAHSAISLAPVERGPVYVTRNDASYHSLFLKMSVGTPSEGWTYIYHNSGYTMLTGNEATMVRFNDYSLPDKNRVLKNNAMIGSEWAVQRGRSKVHTLDYNCYYHLPGQTTRKFQWDEQTCRDIEGFISESGQELHGMYADPLFKSTPDLGKYAPDAIPTYNDVSTGDLHPQKDSPLIDKGEVLRGINDTDYKGAAPDIGAFEFQQ